MEVLVNNFSDLSMGVNDSILGLGKKKVTVSEKVGGKALIFLPLHEIFRNSCFLSCKIY